MEKKTFVLSNKKTFRRGIRVFIKGKDGKYASRLCTFTTEHLVDEKQRSTNARKKAAEFITENEEIINGLFHDPAYGKDFYLKGDEEAKLKKEATKINNEDAKRIALNNLFDLAGLPFDDTKSFEVLQAEYNLYAESLSGRKITKSTATSINYEEKNVAKEISDAKEAARQAYREKYGKEIPAEVANDVAFLDGMSNPNFDAEKYLASKGVSSDEDDDDPGESEDKTKLHDMYFEKFGKNVPNLKVNDLAWIKAKLEE